MGRIKTKPIKNAALRLVKESGEKFSIDFKHNKEVLKELGVEASPSTKNKIAGAIVRLLKAKKF